MDDTDDIKKELGKTMVDILILCLDIRFDITPEMFLDLKIRAINEAQKILINELIDSLRS
jgi:hypothetical protein